MKLRQKLMKQAIPQSLQGQKTSKLATLRTAITHLRNLGAKLGAPAAAPATDPDDPGDQAAGLAVALGPGPAEGDITKPDTLGTKTDMVGIDKMPHPSRDATEAQQQEMDALRNVKWSLELMDKAEKLRDRAERQLSASTKARHAESVSGSARAPGVPIILAKRDTLNPAAGGYRDGSYASLCGPCTAPRGVKPYIKACGNPGDIDSTAKHGAPLMVGHDGKRATSHIKFATDYDTREDLPDTCSAQRAASMSDILAPSAGIAPAPVQFGRATLATDCDTLCTNSGPSSEPCTTTKYVYVEKIGEQTSAATFVDYAVTSNAYAGNDYAKKTGEQTSTATLDGYGDRHQH